MDKKVPDFEMPEIPKDESIGVKEKIEDYSGKQLTDKQVTKYVKTMRALNETLRGALPEGFKRVKMGKLIVPKSFITHVNRMCELLDVTPTVFYQGLMMDAMNRYIEKMQAVVLNASLNPNAIDTEAPETVVEKKMRESLDQLNEMVKRGEYNEGLTPAENLKKIYEEGEA